MPAKSIARIPMTSGEAMIFALTHGAIADALRPHISESEFELFGTISTSSKDKLHRVLIGELVDESNDPLPSLSFIRHCGTPLAKRYSKETLDSFFSALGHTRGGQVRATLLLHSPLLFL